MSDAPEQIWIDLYDETQTSGAMIGKVYSSDLGDIEYIRADLAQAAEITRLRAKVEAAENLAAVLDTVSLSDLENGDFLKVCAALSAHEEAGK
jgi:hypothetical protein